MKLDVWMERIDTPVGTLERFDDKTLRFTYTTDAVTSGNPDRRISIALPLRDEAYGDAASVAFFRIVAREMFTRKTCTKADGKLDPKTTRKYLKGIRQVLNSLGANVTVLSQIIANNKDSRKSAKAEKRMTKKNQDFCKMLIENLHRGGSSCFPSARCARRPQPLPPRPRLRGVI